MEGQSLPVPVQLPRSDKLSTAGGSTLPKYSILILTILLIDIWELLNVISAMSRSPSA